MTIPVLIVGGGPVGLLLACLLTQAGVACRIIETRTGLSPYSRAIGIHPPGQAVLEQVGVAGGLCAQGVAVQQGRIYYEERDIGGLSFAETRQASKRIIGGNTGSFALIVPQTVTETRLEARLHELDPDALMRGVTVTGLHQNPDSVIVETTAGEFTAKFVVGCDGKKSHVREWAGIRFSGRPYPDHYLMGDFADDTRFGDVAVLFLTRHGIVESFPLPEKQRRWVAYMDQRGTVTTPEALSEQMERRLHRRLPVETCFWTSGFGIAGYLAETMAVGRIFLAGDAAHVVSPIGGQGMNLGFLDAARLVPHLCRLLDEPDNAVTIRVAGQQYTARSRQVARIALKRAEFNTVMGRPCPPYSPRLGLSFLLANVPPAQRYMARLFTMRDLTV